MTDDEINEFIALFRKYRDDDKLPPVDRERFRHLSELYRKMTSKPDKENP